MNIAAPETMPSTTALSEPHTGTAAIPSSAVSDRASRLYSRMLSSVQYRTHRMFAVILILQWLGGIAAAFWLSPLTWLGASSRIHLHVWLAVFLGGAITVVPIILSILRPAASVTRHVVCISQALWSALLIHLLGGRMETHFHVFGSLALIACYRDWRVLASASAVVVIDHLARGIYFPMSVYGTQTAASWRTLEHAAWVVFTNIFLLISLKQQHEHMQALAIRHAELEKSYQDVEETVEDRTRQLTHLQQENSRYSAFIESCEHAIVGTRPDGTIYSWNPGAEELYGYTADEAIGKSVCMLVPSPLQAELADIHNEVRSGTPVLNVETQRLRRNGTLCDISLSVWPSFDDSGQPVGCVSVARDITRHREMERAIELSEKRLDRAVRATSDGPWEWNIETHEVWCTPRFFELLGYADREIEMSFAEWESRLHPDDYAAVFEALQRSIDHGELLDVEYRLLTKSDDWKWLRARGACEHNSDGQAVRMAGSIQDIDQQKSQESLLAAQEETLQRRQKLEAVGSLAGGIAHEFNNLLQAIRGYTQFAQSGLDEKDQRFQDLAEVLKASDRAARLTSQLLCFSRAQEFDVQRIDTASVMHDLERLLKPVITEHISIRVKWPIEIHAVLADATGLQQALLNLCVNARDAMSEGGELLVRAETVEFSDEYCDIHGVAAPGTYVCFSITDTGTGIAPEHQKRIFEPFFTTKEVGKGTGMGLSMVHGFVERHGGVINLYSELNAGTTFRMFLPAADNNENSRHLQSPPSGDMLGGDELLLIAEDEPMVRAVLERILTNAGYRVLSTEDGQEATEVFAEHHHQIALTLLDVVMPKMTGRQAYEQIHTLAPEARVIFCTGYDPETSQAETLRRENLPLIQKPYHPDQLLQIIRKTLDHHSTIATPEVLEVPTTPA